MRMLYVGKSHFGRRIKSFVFLFIISVAIYFLVSYYMHNTSKQTAVRLDAGTKHSKIDRIDSAGWEWVDNTGDQDVNLHSVPAYLLQDEKCPACYGEELCEEINNGELKIEMPKIPTAASKKGVYFGQWQGKKIALKTLDNEDFSNFQKFDRFICANQSLSSDCDTSSAVLNPKCVAMQEASFLPENLQEAWRIAHTGTDGLV